MQVKGTLFHNVHRGYILKESANISDTNYSIILIPKLVICYYENTFIYSLQ